MANSTDGRITIDTEIDDSGIDKGTEGIKLKINSLEKSAENTGTKIGEAISRAMTYDSINRGVDSMVDQLQRLRTQAEQGFSSWAQFDRWSDSVDIMERKAERLRSKLEQLGNTKIYSEDYQWYAQELKKAEAQAARLGDRLVKMESTGIDRNSAAFKNLQYDIEQTNRQIADYKGMMSDMESAGTAFTLGKYTGEYRQTEADLQAVESELRKVRSIGEQSAEGLNSFRDKHPILAALGSAAQKAGKAFLTMGKAIGKAAINTFSNAVKKLGNGLKSVASGAKRAVSNLLHFNKTAKAGVNPINGLVKGLTSFKTMLLSRIKSTIISSITSQVKEGIQQFALYSSSFNRAMSNIKNTSSQISGNIASLFANIITVIEPALTRLLSLINSVITAVSALFAKLSGKSTVAVAAKGTADYATGLDSAAGAASDAAKEQKKFNAELYGWDELTRQSKQEDTSSGGGGGSTGPTWTEVPVDDVLKDWEDIDWFQLGYDWAEKLANALDSIPWDSIQAAAYRLGQHFAELLNGVFANLHLADSLGTTIAEALNTGLYFALGFLETFDFSQFGKWAGTLWNAFVDNFDFDRLEKVIKLGGNGIVAAFTSFFQTIASTCETLGDGVAKIFNGIFADIDFKAAADAILLGVHDINLAIKGFVDGVKWDEIALNIKNGINTLISGMVLDENGDLTNVWAENGTQIGRLIGEFWNTAYDTITGLDYIKLGENLALWLTNAINEIDPEKVGGTLGGIIRGIIDTAFSFKESINADELAEKLKAAAQSLIDKMNEVDPATGLNGWQKLGSTLAGVANGIVTAFESIPWGEVAAGVGEAIGTALSEAKIEVKLALGAIVITKIASVILGSTVGQGIGKILGEKILTNLAQAWPTLGTSIKTAISNLGVALSQFATTDVLAASAGQIGAAIFAGLFIGGEIGKLIDNYVIGPLIEALGGDQVTAELYKNFHWFGEGGFFDEMWTDNATFLENVQIWGDALGMMFSDFGTSISDTWSNCWNGVRDFVGPKVESIKTTVSEGWNNLKTNTSEAWGNIKQGISDKWENIKTTTSTVADNIKTKVSGTWDNMKTNTSTAYGNIKTTVESKFRSAKTSVSTAVTNMKEDAVTGWQNMVQNCKKKFSDIYSNAKSKMQDVTGHLKGIQWGDIGRNLVNGLLNGIKGMWDSLTRWVSDAASALTSKVKGVLGINSPSKEWAKIGVFLDEGLEQGLRSGERNMLATASGLASSLTDRMTGVNGSVSLTNDGDIERLGIITGKLSGIAAIIDHIADALASMGGLQIPQIAMGTVAPYRTRAAAMADSDSYNMGEDPFASEAVQLLRNIRDYLAAGGGSNGGDIKVIIDGREVFNAVVNENNRALRRTGGVSPLKV